MMAVFCTHLPLYVLNITQYYHDYISILQALLKECDQITKCVSLSTYRAKSGTCCILHVAMLILHFTWLTLYPVFLYLFNDNNLLWFRLQECALK